MLAILIVRAPQLRWVPGLALTEKAGTQPGVGVIPKGKTDTGSEEFDFPESEGGGAALPFEEDGDAAAEEATAERRYPARARRAPDEWYRANVAVETGEHPKGSGEHPEPQTYREAVGGEESELWRKSMDEEMRSLLENGTWELVEKPEGVKPVTMKWVYKIKRDAQGNVEWYKSWLVAKGYLQRQGIDFEEGYTPVSKHTTLRALLAVVAARDLELHQLDVKTAFLDGELEEEIYVQQPQGYE